MKNNTNYLKRVRAVCEVYQKYRTLGVNNRTIWKLYIKDVYFISERTLYNYLGVNYKKPLSEVK